MLFSMYQLYQEKKGLISLNHLTVLKSHFSITVSLAQQSVVIVEPTKLQHKHNLKHYSALPLSTMPKLEVAHSNINKTPSFTSIGSGGGGVGGGDHEVKPRDHEKADHPLKDEKPNNKRPPRTHRRPQRQKKQLDKQTEQQQQQQQQQQLQRPSRQLKVNADVKKTDAITSSAKDFDSLNTTTTTTATTTATSTPSRPARGGHPLGHKSPVKMAITTTSSGSPLSMGVHGGGVGNSSRGGGDGDDCRTGEMGVGGHLQSNYPTFAHPSMQQQQQQSFLQWPPPPYHPFYSKAASFQYRNQTHQSKGRWNLSLSLSLSVW